MENQFIFLNPKREEGKVQQLKKKLKKVKKAAKRVRVKLKPNPKKRKRWLHEMHNILLFQVLVRAHC